MSVIMIRNIYVSHLQLLSGSQHIIRMKKIYEKHTQAPWRWEKSNGSSLLAIFKLLKVRVQVEKDASNFTSKMQFKFVTAGFPFLLELHYSPVLVFVWTPPAVW